MPILFENARMQRNADALNRKIRESIALVNGPMILVETIIFGGKLVIIMLEQIEMLLVECATRMILHICIRWN